METRITLCAGGLSYFLLFAPDKETLHGWRTAVIDRLARLRLTLHEGRAQIYPTAHGIPFLGFVIYPHHRQLKRRKGIAYQQRLRRLLTAYQRKRQGRAAIDHSVRGWINHVRYADSWGLRRTILKEVRL